MKRTLQLRKGTDADMNTDITKDQAIIGEPHYATDNKQLYVFDGTTNELVAFPSFTTTARDLLTWVAGQTIFNTTTSKHQGYDGSTWNDFY